MRNILFLLIILIPFCIFGESKEGLHFKEGYKIGPGDVLYMKVYGEENLTGEYIVDEMGNVCIPLIGDIYVEGKTLKEIKNLLIEKLKKYIVSPIVSVSIKEYRSRKVTVLGEISPGVPKRGGVYILKGPTRLSECIAFFGGFTEKADIKNIKIRKKNGEIITIDFTEVLLRNNIRKDVFLEDGDMIYVPLKEEVKKNILVLGEVKNPGIYDFKEKITISEVIAKAGGFTEEAILSNIKIIKDIEKKNIITFNFAKLLKGKCKNIELKDKYIVYVPKSFIGSLNYIIRQVLPTAQLLGWVKTITE